MSSILDDIKFQYRTGGIANKMIYWNVGVFLLSVVFFYQFKLGYFNYPKWLALSSNLSTVLTRPWTLLSYAFLHADIWTHNQYGYIICIGTCHRDSS